MGKFFAIFLELGLRQRKRGTKFKAQSLEEWYRLRSVLCALRSAPMTHMQDSGLEP